MTDVPMTDWKWEEDLLSGGTLCCGSCRYWVIFPAEPLQPVEGTCQRYPPQGIQRDAGDYGELWGVWPIVTADEWCGEWSATSQEDQQDRLKRRRQFRPDPMRR